MALRKRKCQMEKIVFSITFLFIVFRCDGQITSNLQDEIKCTGDSVTLNWAYTTANELIATWQFGTNTIMTSVTGGTPTVDNAYTGRATHGGNGVLTLTGLTTADSGTYSLGITYSVAPVSASDSVQVQVYDRISQGSIPQCDTDTNTVTCGSSSLSGVTYAWTVDGSATSDSSWSISSRGGTKTYACTISGDRVTNCLDAGIATTNSKSCTFEANESGGLSPCGIAGIVIAVVEIIAAVVLAILWCKKLLCFKEPKLSGYDKAGIVIAVLVGVVVIPVVVIVILWKKKLLCFKVPTEEKPTGSTDSGDKKIDRLSVVDEKALKLKTPGHLTADTVASPKPRALPPIPEKEAKKEKKKGSKKKRKKTKNEDGGEESVKVPSIEKREKNMEHYTENTKEYESQ